MTTLHLVFHPNLSQSRINKTWKKQIEESGAVALTRDLYAEYPDFKIDVAKEQERLVAHDTIVVQFPVYWYSTPPLLKKWFDDVLTYGFAYGSSGDKLQGKTFQVIASTGGKAEDYTHEGGNRFTLKEFFRPIEQTAVLCGMTFATPLVMNGALEATEEGIEAHGNRWISALS